MFSIGRPRGTVRPQHYDCPGPVELTVRCSGQMHVIRWEKGHVRFAAHRCADLLFELSLKGEQRCRCAEIFDTIRHANPFTRERLPKLLRHALDGYGNHRRSEGHGQGIPPGDLSQRFKDQLREDAIREHFLPLIKALQVDGLAVHLGFPRATNIPEAMAFLLSSATVNSGERGLAVYRRGTWHLDVPRILERGCSLGEFLDGLTVNYAGCRICPTGQGDAPTTRRHLATREHRTRLLRVLQKHFPPKSFGRFASVLTEGPRR